MGAAPHVLVNELAKLHRFLNQQQDTQRLKRACPGQVFVGCIDCFVKVIYFSMIGVHQYSRIPARHVGQCGRGAPVCRSGEPDTTLLRQHQCADRAAGACTVFNNHRGSVLTCSCRAISQAAVSTPPPGAKGTISLMEPSGLAAGWACAHVAGRPANKKAMILGARFMVSLPVFSKRIRPL